jgi:hypothetical protein
MSRATDLSDDACREIAGAALVNHIWINAFTLVSPSDETLRDIGRAVVAMLREKENLLPSRAQHGDKLSELTPTLYMSINQS